MEYRRVENNRLWITYLVEWKNCEERKELTSSPRVEEESYYDTDTV